MFKKQNVPWNKSKKYPSQSKRMKERYITNGLPVGDKNSNWKGGISFLEYPKIFKNNDFKKSIRDRDDNICQICGKDKQSEVLKRNLAVNHIDGDKQNCSPENLNTLCYRCNCALGWIYKYFPTNIKTELMRFQHLKLQKNNSTKAERIVAEVLKDNHIKFRTKVKINNHEVDFLIFDKICLEIDGHEQDTVKNELLAKSGYVPLHLNNKEVSRETIINLINNYGFYKLS